MADRGTQILVTPETPVVPEAGYTYAPAAAVWYGTQVTLSGSPQAPQAPTEGQLWPRGNP